MSSTYDVIARGGLAWFLLGLAACEAPPRDTATEELTSSAELARLYDEIWVDTLANSALLRVREGAPVEYLDDLSNVSFRDSIGRSRDWLERLEAIDLDRLEHADWINARALRWDLETALESERWFWHEGVFTPYLSPLPSLRQIFQSLDVGNAAGRADYLDLLRHVRAFVEQLQERAHGQADRGIAVWRPNLETAVALVRAQVGTAALGPFAVGASRLEAVERTDADSFLAGIDSILDQQIHPALELLASFLEGDYAASAPDVVGASQLPDGADWYRFATRRSTTLAVEPEEVHEIGLELVAGMEAEMAAIRAEIDFKGSRERFHRMLRTESRFFPDTPEEVRERLMAAATAMDEVVESYFLRRPSAPFSARRLDQDLEASQTYGFYQPPSADRPAGTYHYNGSRLDERSWLNLAAVALHELIPGHHFHIARQYENAALPELRRGSLHAAFTEGWGSYSSVLGLEAGI
ncbi:MAG: DUF885 domain-containing protein, partial [Acidobacteria bacterium]|nr:DUF885 domain-containing protein [Acidobacteriota bacterium]